MWSCFPVHTSYIIHTSFMVACEQRSAEKNPIAGEKIPSHADEAQGNLTVATLPNGTAISYLSDGQHRRVGK
jgi:hypothetical protein